MARTDRRRPTRQIAWIRFEDHAPVYVDGVPVFETVEQEVGRRAGLHTHKSQVSERRRRGNRRDRAAARRQLRNDPENTEFRQPRGQAVWLAL
jgi:hypothetical protein